MQKKISAKQMGKMGGKASVKKKTKKELSDWGKKTAKIRWDKVRAEAKKKAAKSKKTK